MEQNGNCNGVQALILTTTANRSHKFFFTLSITETEWQKTKTVTIPLPRAAGSCLKAKKMKPLHCAE